MYYPMEESRQGLIIVNTTFKQPYKYRKGAEKDRKHLIEVYEHLNVGYEVANDLRKNKMIDKINLFSKNIKKPCSVIFVSISTHGKDNGGLLCVDGMFVSVGEIVRCFEKKELLGIPKIFIIQACKGNAKEERECEGDSTHSDSTIPTQYCTKRADVLIAYSTSEGCLSYRNTENGSWFIEVLKDCVTNPEYEKMHFVEILTICTNRIINKYKDRDKNSTSEFTQTPSYCSTLRRSLKFEKREQLQSNEPRSLVTHTKWHQNLLHESHNPIICLLIIILVVNLIHVALSLAYFH